MDLTLELSCCWPQSCLTRSRAAGCPAEKEYLSETEGEKIRDAGTTGPRIVLYAAFAADRIKNPI